MSIVQGLAGQGLPGTQGPMGATSSGGFYALALAALTTISGRIFLVDLCCDSYTIPTWIDPASMINYNSNGYCQSLTTSSGLSSIVPLGINIGSTSSGIVDELVLMPSGNIYPTPREGHAIAFAPDYNSLFIFGGSN